MWFAHRPDTCYTVEMTRPKKLSEDEAQWAREAYEALVPVKEIADALGISRQSLYNSYITPIPGRQAVQPHKIDPDTQDAIRRLYDEPGFTVAQIAEQLNVCVPTVYRYARPGPLLRSNTSGITGVSQHPDGKWKAQMGYNLLGYFGTKEEAVAARRKAENEPGR